MEKEKGKSDFFKINMMLSFIAHCPDSVVLWLKHLVLILKGKQTVTGEILTCWVCGKAHERGMSKRLRCTTLKNEIFTVAQRVLKAWGIPYKI